MHKFCRRQLLLVGPYRPAIVIEVEHGVGRGQVNVGLPVRIDRSHIPPVVLLIRPLFRRMDATHLERMRQGNAVTHGGGNDVLAKIVAGRRIGNIALKLTVQIGRIEDVDPHAAQRALGLARHRRRIGGLLDKVGDAPFFVDRHHPEARRILARHFDAGNRTLGAAFHVIDEHGHIIHLVDVVPRQDDDKLRRWRVILDDVDVLIDSIRRAPIPGILIDPLLGRHEINELIDLPAQETPSALQVAQEAVRLVLRHHANAPDPRIHAIGHGEIYDAVLAAKIDRRLGSAVGEFMQAATTPPCQDQRNGPAGQLENTSFDHLASLHAVKPDGSAALLQLITSGALRPVYSWIFATFSASATSGASASCTGTS